MKTVTRLLGIIAIAAVMAFAMAACDSGGGGGSDSGGVMVLTFTNEQVYTMGEGEDIVFIPYTGSMTVTNNQGGASGSISGGKLSFTIGEPTGLGPAVNQFDGLWNVSVSPNDTRAAHLVLNNFALTKSDGAMSSPTNAWQENIDYYFVDKGCTVSIPAMSEDGITVPAATLRFNEGWNAVSTKLTLSGSVITGEIKVTGLSSGKWTIDN